MASRGVAPIFKQLSIKSKSHAAPMNVRGSPPACAYFDRLPDELLEFILALIDNAKALYCLTQVSRRVRGFAEILLYNSITIRTGTKARKLWSAIDRDPERAAYIHTLDLRCDGRYEEGWCDLQHVLARARNLRELIIESSACRYTSRMIRTENRRWDAIETSLYDGLCEARRACSNCDRGRNTLHCCIEPTKGLAHLSKVTLHLATNESRFWDSARRWDAVMAINTLEELTLSCACVHDGFRLRGRSTSSLKRLTLIECNITIAGFLVLMAKPVALEELHLGENRWRLNEGIDIPAGTNQPYNVLTYRSPTTFLDALEFQQSSLRRLSYDVSLVTGIPRKLFRNARLDRFKHLEEVSFCNPPESFERCMFEEHTPPQLRIVRLEFAWDQWAALHDKACKLIYTGESRTHDVVIRGGLLMYACETALQVLKELHIVINSVPRRLSKQQADRMLHAGRQWWRRQVKLHIYFRERGWGTPPYLFDHVPPEDLLVYKGGEGFMSDIFGFRDGLEDYDLAWRKTENSSMFQP